MKNRGASAATLEDHHVTRLLKFMLLFKMCLFKFLGTRGEDVKECSFEKEQLKSESENKTTLVGEEDNALFTTIY